MTGTPRPLVDVSPRSTVVVCPVCGWRDVFTDQAIALRVSADHHAQHDAQQAAEQRANAARMVARRSARHADTVAR